MSVDSYLKKNQFLVFIVFFVTIYLVNGCTNFVIFEYLKIKFINLENLTNLSINTQFVNESSQGKICVFTVSETIYNQNGIPELFKIFLPRQARVLVQQILILIVVATVLLKGVNYKQTLKAIDFKFFTILFIGLFASFTITSIYVDFETFFYNVIFVTFSIFKAFVAFIYSKHRKSYIKLFILCLFPFFSTGFGISWMFDFMIYFLLFNFLLEKKISFKNKNFLILIFVLSFSLLSPLLSTPSIETQIIENPNEYKNIVGNLDFETTKNTYLEQKDIVFLNENIYQINNEELKKEVVNLSRNLKDVNYPNRWGIMVSFLPDFKYHIPSFIWYLNFCVLFMFLVNQIKNIEFNDFKDEIQTGSNILIFYPILAIFTGINYFFNSISEFLFFLTRNSEMIDFGEIQTWRGINTHYEIFSNLQLFCFCFFAINFYLNRSSKNFIYIILSCSTALLSQSRFTALILFILIFLLVVTFFKRYKIELISLVISVVILFQFIPIFERDEPFFVEESNLTNIGSLQTDLYGFEVISDRLNRTLPWTMFASGYKPNFTELIFGHGSGAYLNIIKFTERKVASGPHSMLLQVLNKFGLIGLLIFSIYIFRYFLFLLVDMSFKNASITFIIFSLLLSLELKTDSIMLADGVIIFLFNIALGIIYRKLYIDGHLKNN